MYGEHSGNCREICRYVAFSNTKVSIEDYKKSKNCGSNLKLQFILHALLEKEPCLRSSVLSKKILNCFALEI